MAWYKTGTVTVTNGSPTITGAGTAWVANAKVGAGFKLPGGDTYEITAVNSDTQITIAPAYLGSTQSGQAYAILPLVGFYQRAYDALEAAQAQWQSYLSGVLAGLFGSGTVGAPGLAFQAETNTGFFRKAAGQLGVAVQGVQRLLVSSTAFKIDVPVTGTAVQSSATDSTAGRLLTVGAFGLGPDAGPILTDLDGDTPSGFFMAYGGAHGAAPTGENPFPSLNGAFGLIIGAASLGGAGEYIFQIAAQYANSAAPAMYRTKAGATWGPWQTLYSSGNVIGTVSQSGGVPTGAIIESGSNANGNYVRFADGTQICDLRDTSLDSGGKSWTFPAAFVSAPQVSVTCNQDLARFSTTTSGTATSVSFSVWNTAQARVVAGASLMAIGRWF